MIQSSNTPRVVIIGAGAMGSLFGFLLHRAGKDVWLLDKDESLAEQVRRHGLVVEAADGIHHCS
ncbi:MAG TPA: 2-dehydropantoate 2-reductase N-terminal domain-containing protein, partial [Thermodesulfobacteriota bacterium]|nr:2-dehydropantoate 2-reductase N-terminal domain-containing protein [Thermodesulfobacteriota bacterium]